ncbi:hypothetical protein ACQEU5_02865 [Marinactinospora thermotolerans]|uniref:hypothetical protein n=1 Tax=Marinactinospora thermotolerans TaxID=531310 RepID=UPI001F20296A|nr:hypothetical protein [Marinactinospora thermotolerans]
MKWFLQRVLAALATLVVVAVGAGALLGMQYQGEPAEWARSGGDDAIWLGHAWVDGRNGEAEFRALAERVSNSGIRDLYVHTGPLAEDGTLDPELHPTAADFVDRVHEELPEVRVSAWLGQLVPERSAREGRLELAEEETRANVVAAARTVMEIGFDGVHYNFEPLSSGDWNFLSLLEETRAAIGEEAWLSSAVAQIEPIPGFRLLAKAVVGRDKYWSTGYLTRVAELVDQVAIMTYDTGMPMERLYGGYVVHQTRMALDAVPEDVGLLMGVPAYDDEHVMRDPEAETMETATRAVRLGMSERLTEPREGAGVAIYVDFEATDRQWDAYRDGWFTPAAP